MQNKIFLMLTCLLAIVSCNKEDSNEIQTSNQGSIEKEGVIEGVYHFDSKESFTKTMEEMKDNKPLLEKTMKSLYLDGFRSNSPVGDIENDAQLISINERRSVTTGRNPVEEEFEEDSENNLIADPVLSAFVNEQNEIAINDTLYKFTNRGIFSAQLKDAEKMLNYVANLPSSEPTEQEVSQLRENFSGKTQVAEGVYRFIAPVSQLEKSALEERKSSMTGRFTPWEQLHPIINDLPVSEGTDNWWLHNIVGTSKVAEEYFDRRHRVKLEFWTQDYGFYKSIGISVRNQVRRFRIWWASEADEVVLGINYAYMTFVMPTAPIPNFNPYFDNSFTPKPILYGYEGNIVGGTGNTFFHSTLQRKDIALPFFKFDNEQILNIFIPKVPIVGDFGYTLETQDIISQSNIKKLYENGFNLLKSIAPHKNEIVVVKEGKVFPNELEVVYLSEGYQAANTNKYKKHFDKDFGGTISFSVGNIEGNGNPNFNFTGVNTIELRDYKNIKIDFYGMARRGGTWKGARIVF